MTSESDFDEKEMRIMQTQPKTTTTNVFAAGFALFLSSTIVPSSIEKLVFQRKTSHVPPISANTSSQQKCVKRRCERSYFGHKKKVFCCCSADNPITRRFSRNLLTTLGSCSILIASLFSALSLHCTENNCSKASHNGEENNMKRTLLIWFCLISMPLGEAFLWWGPDRGSLLPFNDVTTGSWISFRSIDLCSPEARNVFFSSRLLSTVYSFLCL